MLDDVMVEKKDPYVVVLRVELKENKLLVVLKDNLMVDMWAVLKDHLMVVARVD
jgi:hypothetical protein